MKHFLFILNFLYSFSVCAQVSGNCNTPFDSPDALVEILIGEVLSFLMQHFLDLIVQLGSLMGPQILALNLD